MKTTITIIIWMGVLSGCANMTPTERLSIVNGITSAIELAK